MRDPFARHACDHALRQLAEGDQNALASLHERLGRKIYLLALSILRDPHAAEDILQDTWLRLAQGGARSYTPDTNPEAFVLTVARNLALTALTRRARELPSEIAEDAEPHLTAPDSESMSTLPVLDELDTEERQIVLLRLEYGMKHRDIAALLGISTAACEKKYSRAAAKMRDYYRDRHVTKSTERGE
jgi:RNA polymerase sigma-70 factor (ECF subfamily)